MLAPAVLNETWRAVPEWEGHYEVSDHGRVRSLERRVRGKHRSGTVFMRRVPPRILKPGRMNEFGHVSVSLGRHNSHCVHELVMAAFVGPRPEKHEVAHRDGNGSNNILSNLRYSTRRDNNFDRAKLGRTPVPKEAVIELRTTTASASSIARKYGFSVAHACKIRRCEVRIYA